MRWNCPHCGVALSVADDRLNTGWSYAKCYQCSEFAMVRRTATPVQTLPKPRALSAIQAPNEIYAPNAMIIPEEKTETQVKRATVRKANTAANINQAKKAAAVPPRFSHPSASVAVDTADISISSRSDESQNAAILENEPVLSPAPLRTLAAITPELPKFFLQDPPSISRENRIMRVAASFAGVVAIASGIYLYMEGQKIWEKAKLANARTAPAAELIQHPRLKTVASTLGISRTPGFSVAQNTGSTNANAAGLSDQISHQAMAPIRQDINELNKPASMAKINSVAVSPAPAAGLSPVMWIRPRAENISLRSGPGLEHPIVSTAQTKDAYRVLEWKDRWFRVQANHAANAASENLWIRNDLVTPVPNPQ